MKNGTFYAKRVKRLFSMLKKQHGAPDIPEPVDPVEQLILALLSYDASEAEAVDAVKALSQAMVDLNEIRVSTIAEITAVIRSHIANPANRAAAIRSALNAVFRRNHRISLAPLHKLGRREARQYLEKLKGVNSFAAASVMLWSLGAHAIPVSRRMFERLREQDLIDPAADIDEVQAFLERNISATDAKVFCLLMRDFVDSKPQESRAPGRETPARAVGAPNTPAKRSKSPKAAARKK